MMNQRDLVSSKDELILQDARYGRRKLAYAGTGLLLLVVALAGILYGAIPLTLHELLLLIQGQGTSDTERIVYYLRLPRVICAALVGMNLALAGCILQGVLHNLLADPGIIGVTAGAGVAAMAVMILAPAFIYWVPLAAFVGALVALAIVFLLAWNRGINPLRLILAGVAVAAFFGGGTTALWVAFPDRIQGAVNWLAGGFAGARWSYVWIALPYSVIGLLGTLWNYRKLNALQMGDEVALSLGINLKRTRFILIFLAAILAASSASVAGLLGFVGLIVPHIMRLIVGSDFEYLLPASAVFGAALLVGADTFARTAFSPMEIPVGIFLSFLGAPFFLYLLKRRSRG
ncbi:iron ABC transporter permease [uncultured Veillonella sp.]|uniref:FecCD family ABC transporter permease n=1 Tax=uncultured Veillonella sp. TaxID=159268 RepID=UPI0026154AEB|nr:iron ABC transporter permease [uncultured Veillonella sp.]